MAGAAPEHPEEDKTEAQKPAKAEKLETLPDSPNDDDELEEFADEPHGGDFGENFRGVLQASGLRLSNVLGCFFALLLIAGSVYFFFFSSSDFFGKIKSYLPEISFLKSGSVQVQISPRDVPSSDSDLKTAFLFGSYRGIYLPPSIEIASLFGGIAPTMFFAVSTIHTGMMTAYTIGFRGEALVRFSQYIANISQIQNILNTDVNAVINASSNRKASFDSLLESFQNLLTVSNENADFVKKEVITLRESVRVLSEKVAAAERLFNADIAKFLPGKTSEDLDSYILLARDHRDAKARLGAFSKVDQYYQVAIAKLTARVRDIRDNEDALIKGVKVFDIKNSDLNLIIYDGQPPAEKNINAIDRSKEPTGFSPFGLAPSVYP
jgi:hypothetical protein